ncbi:MAG: TRAP transporter small permease [Aminobacterium sp.]|uniref:TRAP transporter small permease n=1 Tax=unclassified Aminobacterium TaxID=2685012 RepID=UPI001BCA76B9|nr:MULTISPECIES: TRAP transporter small permease [unclassified Aminobacterium]MDD2207582.1 TRAP transporter small permease [Aminobacterium sp.]MDD3427051.1 TRAP transporter small permease [Aminobacterium sp.]MDD3708218.1 TRAP transporter small permease [Aminobacterium sp.]MDD4229554.1 TRAP transporter small permease [Aminobacterium sp.]MDD4552411.1 TRAP transporter small permease [Aminobacterium sp.]
MKSVINALYRLMYRFADGMAIFMLGVMVFSVFTNVIFRFFYMAFPWVDEVSRFAFVWMSFMAIVSGLRIGLHPAFDVLVTNTHGVAGKILRTAISVCIVVFLGFLLKGGIDYISRIYVQKTSILVISVAWQYSAVPIATVMMLLEMVRQIMRIWTSKVEEA